MDNFLAIGLGLAVRHVVHALSRADPRMTGTLVGMWEGAVLAHLLKKSRGTLDPLLGYTVRLFVDYYLAENFTRLVLIIVWTGLGVILADIAPALWVDVGFHRYWRRFRRDLRYVSRSMPSVDIFPRARTVRFSPRPTTAFLSDSDTTVTPIPAQSSAAPTRPHSKRHVPGSFESDTDTIISETGSLRFRQSELYQPQRRQSFYPAFSTIFRDNVSDVTSVGHDVDEGNVSSPLSDSVTDDMSAANPNEIPDELELEYIDTKPEEGTPKQRNMGLPTPTDSLHPFDPMRHEDDHVRPPPPADIRTIPDTYDDWENITKNDADIVPPPLPKKDNEHQLANETPSPQPIPPPNPSQPTGQNITSAARQDTLPDTPDLTPVEKPPPYQDTYDEPTDPLVEKPLAGDAADQGGGQDAPPADEEPAMSDGEAKSDISEETLNSLQGLECLEQMARLHQLIVKAKEDYEASVQRHKAVQTSGNKVMTNKEKKQMDAFERKLKSLTNKAEACYLTRTF